jgi:hypothetical protein
MPPTVPCPVLVGRSVELAAVRRLVDAAAAGSGGSLLVLGEAGIGKTRLLDELARRAHEANLLVLTGRAVPGGGTYRPFADAMLAAADRPEFPDLPILRPYRAALGRLLPGWGSDDVRFDVDPAVILAEGVAATARCARASRLCAGAGGYAVGG